MDCLSDQEKAQLKEVFDEVAGGDGKISSDDLKKVFEKIGFTPSDEDIKAVVAAADKDGSGSISFDEFADAIVVLSIKIRIAMLLARLFQALDTDGSGSITKDNLRDLLTQSGAGSDVTDDQLNALIKRADASGDGQVSFEEFVQALASSIDE